MARRRNGEGLISTLGGVPWQVSAVLGCVAYVALRWVVPQAIAGDVYLLVPSHGLASGIGLRIYSMQSVHNDIFASLAP